MFRFRRIYDDVLPADRAVIEEVRKIIRQQFREWTDDDVEGLPDKLRNPLQLGLRSILFVAESARGAVRGFALLMHAPDLNLCYLDLISAAPGQRAGAGTGSALYQRVREEAQALGAIGLFFECAPDDPALVPDAARLKENRSRLAFYERLGARPVIGTAYETPVLSPDEEPPYLMFDDLGSGQPLRRAMARTIVRAILERRHGTVCPESYIAKVVDSFRDDPVRLRPDRYRARWGSAQGGARLPLAPDAPRIVLAVSEAHARHHVRQRTYVEAPVRIDSILNEILPTGLFRKVPVRHFGERHILAVHARDYVDYLRRASENVPEGQSVYPETFPVRNVARPPNSLPLRAGYYCIDTFTPIHRYAYAVAVEAVDCALTAASAVAAGAPLAYALVRPPGHHAERRFFGGCCYFNSAAIAAHLLSRRSPVAMLDLDYHHGNGQQYIFYERADVLTVSLHGAPRTTYPYFSGFTDERGQGEGKGFNLNLPLPDGVPFPSYQEALSRALRRIRRHGPAALVVCLGLDTAKGDPTGSWAFTSANFEALGRAVGSLRLPTLVVQEGGYRTRTLGINARSFFQGLYAGRFSTDAAPTGAAPARPPALPAVP